MHASEAIVEKLERDVRNTVFSTFNVDGKHTRCTYSGVRHRHGPCLWLDGKPDKVPYTYVNGRAGYVVPMATVHMYSGSDSLNVFRLTLANNFELSFLADEAQEVGRYAAQLWAGNLEDVPTFKINPGHLNPPDDRHQFLEGYMWTERSELDQDQVEKDRAAKKAAWRKREHELCPLP